ncbi:MAG: hypothetical protein M1365_15475 [Actinobacteria bacterium]|nr:hypothetical protein [Actinomycetota bacterium]
MNSKERVQTALNHEEPDHVPIDAFFTPEIAGILSKKYNCYENELNEYLGHDVIRLAQGIGTSFDSTPEGETEYYDDWGIKWRAVPHVSTPGVYTEMIIHPLSGDKDKLNSYKAPDPDLPKLEIEAKNIIEKYGKTHAVIGVVGSTIFEGSWYLRGFEQFLQDLILDKDYTNALMDITMEYHLSLMRRMVKLGYEYILTGDDVGMQSGMLISPEKWREFLKPRYAYMFQELRKINPGVKFLYHSDGYIEPIIPEFIEIGLDVLNPIQPKCMNPAEIKRKYGKKLSFHGTVDIQEVLPFGSPLDVINEVKERIRTVAPGGGFILSTTHCIQPQTPMRNIDAYYFAHKKFGNYPIRIYR